MPGTKIINVQKNDSFDEVFAAFSSAQAEEVIFIFPRSSIFSKNASYFNAIREEGERSGKKINIMTSDPVIAHLASQSGLGILQNPAPRERRPAPISAPVTVSAPPPQAAPQPVSFAARSAMGPYADQEAYAELAVARRPKQTPVKTYTPTPVDPNRKIRDIVTKDQESVALPIDESQEGDVSLPIHTQEEQEQVEEVTEAPAPAPVIQQPVARTPAPIIPQHQEQSQQPLQPHPLSNDIERLWAEEEQRQQANPGKAAAGGVAVKSGKKISKKKIFIPLGIVLVGVGVFLFFTLGSAKILVSPQKQDLDFKLKINTSTATEAVSSEFNKIPGQKFTAEKTLSGSYPVTSEKDVAQKANGKITIYNKGATEQKLVATTRFESKDGLIFRIPDTVNVPAKGSAMATVYADRPGKEYNIGPTTFTIPGFKDTPKFAEFSATSSASMAGGLIGAGKVVAEQDYIKAKEDLTAKVKSAVTSALKDQVAELKVIEPVQITFEEPVVNAKVGEATESLSMSIKGRAQVIAFREGDVKDLITHYLSKNGDVRLIESGLVLTYGTPTIDKASSSATFELQVKGQAAAELNTEKIKNDIMTMDETSIRKYFEGIKEVASARILLSPFWVTRVPKNPAKVTIVVQD